MSFGNSEYKSWKCLNYFYTDRITKGCVILDVKNSTYCYLVGVEHSRVTEGAVITILGWNLQGMG